MEGKSYDEISQETGIAKKTLQNSFAKGGRLEKPYQRLIEQSQTQNKEAAQIVFEIAKEEASASIERMIELSKSAGTEAALYKANEFILGIVGAVGSTSLRRMLQDLTYEQAINKLEPIFMDLYHRPINGPLLIYNPDNPEGSEAMSKRLKELKERIDNRDNDRA